MSKGHPRLRRVLFRGLVAWILALPAAATGFSPSPDVGVELAGTAFVRGDVLREGAAPAAPPVDLGPLPDGADIVGFTVNDLGQMFFVLGHTVELPGGLVAGPRQVVEYTGGVYSIEVDFDPFLPQGAGIDALGVLLSAEDVLLSFDQPIDLSGLFIDDADVFSFSTGALVLDASAAGVPDGVDVDAIAESAGGDLLVSFDAGGIVAGLVFADEDVLRYALGTGTWSMEMDASSLDGAWHRVDTNAVHFVPEPGVSALWMAGGLGLLALARRRGRRVARRRGGGCPDRGPTSSPALGIRLLVASALLLWLPYPAIAGDGGKVSSGVNGGNNVCDGSTTCP